MLKITTLFLSLTFYLSAQSQCSTTISYIQNDCNNTCVGVAWVYPTNGPGQGPFTYLWSNGETTQTAINLCNNVEYYVTVTDANSCVTVDTILMPSSMTFSTSSVMASCSTCTDGSISIIPTGGPAPYQFSIDNGVTYSGQSNFSGLAPGSYTVCVMNSDACVICDTQVVAAMSTSSLAEKTEENLKLFPNPTRGLLNIIGNQITSIEIMDVTGKVLVKMDHIEGDSFEFDLHHFANGVYMVKVIDDNLEIIKTILLE